MDDLIKKLSDIEDRARMIVEDANAQKAIISEQINQLTQTWDLEKEQETKFKLEQLRERIQSDIEDKLKTQEQYFKDELNAIKLDYEKNKTKYLDLLFQRIIEG